MAVSPARGAAFDILFRVEQEGSYASELLHSPSSSRLSPADHRLATELVMGVLRWCSVLDQHIAQHSSQKLARLDAEVLTTLRLAAYQLLFLDRVPERAAVHESVELVKRARKRSAVPFVNAVLRKLAGTGKQNTADEISVASTSSELAERSAHPQWLVERWIEKYGLDVARQICAYNQQIPETTVRIPDTATLNELKQAKIQLSPGKLLASAYRVVFGDVTSTPAFREGRVIIQDEASQLVALLVGEGRNILDCCAAPGGKTRVLAQQNPRANIFAVDLHPHRARLLRELVTASNVHVMAADARNLPLGNQVDRVLVDVPCSGTGTLGRNPDIKWRIKPDDLADLQGRQTAILLSAMQCVAPGGKLVYSTCSLEEEENAQVVEKAMAADRTFRLLDCAAELDRLRSQGEFVWNTADSLTCGPYLRTLPGVHPCEGFFAAVLQKN
jgi:16S rRNA (cytosine967-C5)-methyltransferase